MPELELIRQGKHQDKDIFFCHFNHRAEGEIRVVVTAQTLSEFNKDCGCDDLVKICRYAAEEAIRAGLKGDKPNLPGSQTQTKIRSHLKQLFLNSIQGV